MARGDFSKSQLQKIRLKAEAMWQDSRLQADFKPYSDSAVAILQNQTARFPELANRNKDNTAVVTFINACGIEAQDCAPNCDLGGEELESGAKEYEIDLCKMTQFGVDAEKSRTNEYEVEEIAARGTAMAIKALDEWWSRQVILKLKSFAGVNVAPQPWTYDPTDKSTDVPAADFNLGMVANLIQQAYLNKMGNPYFLNNGSLWLEWFNRQLDAADTKANAARLALLRMYFDQMNFAQSGVLEDLFMVSPGAVAMMTKNRNPDAPDEVGGKIQQTRYTIPSISLPGVKYDAYYSLECRTIGNKSHDFHSWRFETNGGIWLNPEGCPITVPVGGVPTVMTPTGVLSYTKV